MKTYKISWKVKSTISTNLESDTIFGHICWAILYLYGEERLKDFLSELNTRPCFVLSSGFPEGKVPIPAVPVDDDYMKLLKERLSQSNSINEKEWYEEKKSIKKIRYLPMEEVVGRDVVFSHNELVENYWHQIIEGKKDRKEWKSEEMGIPQAVIHNTINRLTNTTTKGGGNLYSTITSYYPDGFLFNSYIDTDLFSIEELREILNNIQISGFGKNKSTGMGRFDISIKEHIWSCNPEANSFLILSNMVPANEDPPHCFATSDVKHGKVGGSYALSESPFKYPIFFFKPGTVFLSDSSQQKPIGTLLSKIHPDRKELVQNLYAYSVPVKIKELP